MYHKVRRLMNRRRDCVPWQSLTDVANYIYLLNYYAFSALTLLVGQQEGHPACKKLSGGGAGMVVCL